jgi:hypothetical protein
MNKNFIFIILLSTIIFSSCRSRKEASCPSFDIEKPSEKKNNKNSKYEVVILKDGKRINKKNKRRKSKNRLFKRKMY